MAKLLQEHIYESSSKVSVYDSTIIKILSIHGRVPDFFSVAHTMMPWGDVSQRFTCLSSSDVYGKVPRDHLQGDNHHFGFITRGFPPAAFFSWSDFFRMLRLTLC